MHQPLGSLLYGRQTLLDQIQDRTGCRLLCEEYFFTGALQLVLEQVQKCAGLRPHLRIVGYVFESDLKLGGHSVRENFYGCPAVWLISCVVHMDNIVPVP